MVEATTAAKTESVKTLADAEAQRILQAARVEASNLLAQVNEARAQLERDTRLRQATNQVKDTETKVAVIRQQEEARNMELRKKASDPEVQNKLAPFITPGYWQTKAGGMSTEKKPLSLTLLQAKGALDPTLAGFHKLVEVATSPNDRLRPRWQMSARSRTSLRKSKRRKRCSSSWDRCWSS